MTDTIQSIIWDFKVFTQIYVMTNGGGIAGQNLVLNVYAYQKAFASSQHSLGSAIGVVMLVILLAVTLVYLRLVRRQGGGTVSARSMLRICRAGRLAAEAAALLIAAAVASPLYWMVLSALKPAGEIQSTDLRPWTLSPSPDSFRRVFEQHDFGRYFLKACSWPVRSSSSPRWLRSTLGAAFGLPLAPGHEDTANTIRLRIDPALEPEGYRLATGTGRSVVITGGSAAGVCGDECRKDQWKESPATQPRIDEFGLADEDELQSWVVRHFDTWLTARGRRLIGWDEIFEGGTCTWTTVRTAAPTSRCPTASSAPWRTSTASNPYLRAFPRRRPVTSSAPRPMSGPRSCRTGPASTTRSSRASRRSRRSPGRPCPPPPNGTSPTSNAE